MRYSVESKQDSFKLHMCITNCYSKNWHIKVSQKLVDRKNNSNCQRLVDWIKGLTTNVLNSFGKCSIL